MVTRRCYWMFAVALMVSIASTPLTGIAAPSEHDIGYPCFSYMEQVRPGSIAALPSPVLPQATQPTIVVVEQNPYTFMASWAIAISVGLLAFVIERYRRTRNDLELQLSRAEEWRIEFRQQQQQNQSLTNSRLDALEQQVAETRSQDSGVHGHVDRLEAQIKYTEMLKCSPRSAEIEASDVVNPAIETTHEDLENSE